MQYEITLPADYDMNIIRHRVATKGHLLDTFGGLGLKAYCVRERGIDGSPVNQYAPFYLWSSLAGMNRFLWGTGFGGLCEDFGRPVVQHWPGVAFKEGPSRERTPCAASRRTVVCPRDVAPAAIIESALEELDQRSQNPSVHSTALAVDPRTWELLHFTLWDLSAPESEETRYRVLHLSSPHVDEIALGLSASPM